MSEGLERKSFEQNFLMRLAPVYLACRWRVMGHGLSGKFPPAELGFDLLGMIDYAWEMRLICRERLDSKRG